MASMPQHIVTVAPTTATSITTTPNINQLLPSKFFKGIDVILLVCKARLDFSLSEVKRILRQDPFS